RMARPPYASFLRAAALALAATTPATVAHGAPAAARPAPNRTVDLRVTGDGGSFEVGVNPEVVTSFYLPEPVARVVASDQRRFELKAAGSSVTVRPRPGDGGARGTINIDTGSLHLTVVLKLVSFEEARGQVFFRRNDQPVLDAQCRER